jgi:ATP-dependent Lon protease
VPETLPLFPLGTVLFPGVLLPLHIFEERYRQLVRVLVTHAEGVPREFGVVAIRQGWEVGADAVDALHEVGCCAELRQVTRHPDGRYDIVTVGTRRFQLLGVDSSSHPYLVGTVDWLAADEPDPGDPVADDPAASDPVAGDAAWTGLGSAAAWVLAGNVGALFERYVAAAVAVRGGRVEPHTLPPDPTELSYLVASVAMLTLEDRQTLLELPTTAQRLQAEIRMLTRETTMLRTLRVVPAPLSQLPAPNALN